MFKFWKKLTIFKKVTPDEVSELSIPETSFYQQTHTYHSCNKKQCRPIGKTFEDNVFTAQKQLHEPDMKHAGATKVIEKVEEKVTNSNKQPSKV